MRYDSGRYFVQCLDDRPLYAMDKLTQETFYDPEHVATLEPSVQRLLGGVQARGNAVPREKLIVMLALCRLGV